jgi:hypothetical protein
MGVRGRWPQCWWDWSRAERWKGHGSESKCQSCKWSEQVVEKRRFIRATKCNAPGKKV